MKSYFKFKTVSVTVSGDYFQVMFHDGLDTEDEPYFFIQKQFEFNDTCYFECHNEKLIEHSKVKSALLSPNVLLLSYGTTSHQDVEIQFVMNGGTNFQELASALREMIPNIQNAAQ